MQEYENQLGRVIEDRYKLLSLSGAGSYGAVFRAYDKQRSAVVALKLFAKENEKSSERIDFLTEARAIAGLKSEYTVRLYDAGVSNGERYLSMEYVDGQTLREYMDTRLSRKEPIPLAEILTCARQIASALAEAHASGIVHRDIKPQNIIVTKAGQIKITDFGIAQLPTEDPYDNRRAVGTAHYISPEQAGALPVDARSDIYSLGVLLYEMATGELPFKAPTAREIALMQVKDAPRPPRELNRNIPTGLQQIILTAMQKNPDRRFRRMEDLLFAVEKLEKSPSTVFRDFQKDSRTAVGERHRLATGALRSPLLLTVLAILFAVLLLLAVSFLLTKCASPMRLSEYPNLLPALSLRCVC